MIIKSSKDPRIITKQQTATVTVNNSAVLVPVPTLNWNMPEHSKYGFIYIMYCSCNPAADYKFNITGDGTAAGSYLVNCYQNRGLAAIGSDATANANGGYESIMISGNISTDDAGTVVLSFAQSVAHASDCIMAENSMLMAWRM